MNKFKKQISNARVIYLLIAVLFFAPLVQHLAFLSLPLLEGHAYRQTQTALVSFWMIATNEFRLNYLMPVMGYPWSAPLEFPIFQWIVSKLVLITNFDLDKVGRSLSILFYYLTLLPIFYFMRKRGYVAIAIFFAIYLSSPIELFYSRAFLIENIATFLAFTTFVFYLYSGDKFFTLIILFAIGSLAGLQKITTYIPVVLVCLIDTAWKIKSTSQFKINRVEIFRFFAILLSIIPAIVWSKYSDIIKSSGYVTKYLISTVQNDWIFGTIETRMHGNYWSKVFLYRLILLGGFFVPLLVVISAWIKGNIFFSREAVLSIAIGLLGPLIFGPLFYVHDYYLVASIVFISAGISVIISESCGQSRATTFIMVTIILNIAVYSIKYYDKINSFSDIDNNSKLVAKYLQYNVPKDDVIVIIGLDWNSTIPYYSKKYSLMIPSWMPAHSDVIAFPEKFIGTKKIGGVVICRNNIWPINVDKFEQNNLMNKVHGPTVNIGSCIVKTN